MNDPTPEERRLRDLLADAVADVHPPDRLAAIRARTTEEETMTTDRSRPLIVLGAVVATAAVISAIAWAGGVFSGGDAPPVASDPTPTVTGSPADESTFTARVFYVGDTPLGPRLFSEVAPVPGSSHPQAAIRAAIEGTPSDPDYESPWPEGVGVAAVDVDRADEQDLVTVRLDGDIPAERPDAMPPVLAELAVQQVAHTAAATLNARPRVVFSDGDGRLEQVLGVDVGGDLVPADPLEVLAHAQIAEPAEGATVSGTLTVSGWSSSFEATVPWQIRSGRDVVLDGFLTAEGWTDDLFPYQDEIDLAELEPGPYTLVVSTDDPTGGAEGPGPTTDTRTFTIE